MFHVTEPMVNAAASAWVRAEPKNNGFNYAMRQAIAAALDAAPPSHPRDFGRVERELMDALIEARKALLEVNQYCIWTKPGTAQQRHGRILAALRNIEEVIEEHSETEDV